MLYRLSHPCLLRVLDAGVDNGASYLVMEYADRGSLARRLVDLDRPVTIPEMLRVARPLAEALSELHRHGVIHRDVKPANLLLMSRPEGNTGPAGPASELVLDDERVVLGDLGAAYFVGSGSTALIGTPQFAAPEQMQAPAVIDQRTDLYSCSVVVHHLLTGRPPAAGHVVDISLPPELPHRERLERFLAVGTAVDPEHRPESASAWLDMLEDAVGDRRPRSWDDSRMPPLLQRIGQDHNRSPAGDRRGQPDPGVPLERPRRRRTRSVVIGATVLALVSVLVVGGALVSRSLSSTPTPVTTEVSRRPTAVAIAPDGQVVAAYSRGVFALGADGAVTDLVGTGRRGGDGDGGPASSAQLTYAADLAFDRDGRLFIADRDDGTVRVVDGGRIGPLVSAQEPVAVEVDLGGGTWIAEFLTGRVLHVDAAGAVSVVATLERPSGLAATATPGEVLVAVSGTARILRLSLLGQPVEVAGNGDRAMAPSGGDALSSPINRPTALAAAPDGSILVVESDAHRVLRITPEGKIVVVAGTGTRGWSGDGGPAVDARLDDPQGVAVAADGTIYIADTGNRAVRTITPTGSIATVYRGA